jgi:hypothetical protein
MNISKQQQQQQITAKTTHYYQMLQNLTQYCPSTVEMNVNQPLKKFPTLYGNLQRITMFKTVQH